MTDENKEQIDDSLEGIKLDRPLGLVGGIAFVIGGVRFAAQHAVGRDRAADAPTDHFADGWPYRRRHCGRLSFARTAAGDSD